MPRIGTSVRASLRAAVRFEKNGLRLQKLSSANVTAGGNLADASGRKNESERDPRNSDSGFSRSLDPDP